MPILGTILGIIFICLLIKAICETIWGICLIINGLFWHAVALVLDAITFIPRAIAKRKERKARGKRIKTLMANSGIAGLIRIRSYRAHSIP